MKKNNLENFLDWQAIEDFPNYEVSNDGDVRNIKTGNILKPFNNGIGYISFNDTLHNLADNDTVLKFGPFIATFVIILFNTLSTTKLLLSTSL